MYYTKSRIWSHFHDDVYFMMKFFRLGRILGSPDITKAWRANHGAKWRILVDITEIL